MTDAAQQSMPDDQPTSISRTVKLLREGQVMFEHVDCDDMNAGGLMEQAADEIERLRAEVASLRLTLGGRTFDATVPEPIGCPTPGACSTVAEIGRLRAIIRVNGIRAGASHAEIDRVICGE